jgi:hypothetical protein
MTGRERSLHTLGALGFSEGEACNMVRLAKSLHTLYVRACNVDQNDEEEARAERYEERERERIEEIAKSRGFKVYHQTDPRGWPVTLYRTRDLTAYQKRSKYNAGVTIAGCYASIGHAII